MILILILIFSFVLALILYKFSFKKSGIELNFFLFFSLGYAYYSILPIAFFFYLENFTGSEFDIIKANIDGINEEKIIYYGLFSLLFYLTFTLGYSIPKKKAYLKPNLNYSNISVSRIYIYIAIILAIFAALPISGDFFKFYSEEIFVGYEDGVLVGASQRGTFVAAVTVLFVSFLYHVSNLYLNNINGSALIFYLKNKYFIVYLFFAILMLSLGGRLYFISHIIALLVMSNVQKPYTVSPMTLFAGLIGLAVMAGFYGIFRAGGGLNLLGILINLVQEPLYTSISLFSYLGKNSTEIFGNPILLISDFSNLLPSVLWPEKAQYIIKPEELGYIVGMPLGGLHFFVSMCINFGYIGSLFVMFFSGFIIAVISIKQHKYFFGFLISLLSAWSTFSLFRDPFSVSIVKNIFQYSLMLSLAMVCFNKLKI